MKFENKTMAEPHHLVVLLGPYRNLTTLTAATLAMHPRVQVLNHAMGRLLENGEADIFARPDEATLDRLLAAGCEMSKAGERGARGGSILLSHAFDDPAVRASYAQRFGDTDIKAGATHLVWKDSMRVQNYLQATLGLIDQLCEIPRITFFLPIRDPLACAFSNLRAHYVHLGLPPAAPIEAALAAVLRAEVWALEQADRRPDRFCIFAQDEPRPDLFRAWAAAARLDSPAEWLEDATDTFKPRPTRYVVDEALLKGALLQVERAFAPWPDLRGRVCDLVRRNSPINS